MGATANVIPDGNPPPPALPNQPPPRRNWDADEIMVAAFAILGFGGAVFLPLRFHDIPPVITSFLLATGLAALAYRYLGGIQGATFSVGAVKLTGSLAALVGIAFLINHTLEQQVKPYRVWSVSGTAVRSSDGLPVKSLDPSNFVFEPRQIQPYDDGHFTLTVSSGPDLNLHECLPRFTINAQDAKNPAVHLSSSVDLNELKESAHGRDIEIGTVTLKPDNNDYNPRLPIKPVSASAKPKGAPQ